MEDLLLLVGDVAKLLTVSPDRVRQMEQKGVLVADRTIGGTRLFKREHVEQLLRERAAEAGRV